MRETFFASFASVSRPFRLGFAFTLAVVLFALAGCGGSAKIGGNNTTTVTSVAASCSPTALAPGQSSTCSATVYGAYNPTQDVTWSVSPASAGTITTGGVFTASASITAATTVTITASSTVPGYTDVKGSATVTVNPVVVPPPTVTISADSPAITLGGSVTITWSSTNATAPCTASGAWSGSEATSGSITETPTATGLLTYTLGCTGSGGSVTASVTVTVNPVPLPDVTGTSVPSNMLSVDWAEVWLAGVSFSTSNSDSTDVLCAVDFNNVDTSAVYSNEATAELDFGTRFYSPGWLGFAVSEKSDCSNLGSSQTLAFTGAQNYLVPSSSGYYFLDQAQGLPTGQNGYIREYDSKGIASGSCFVGAGDHSIAFDKKTNYVIGNGHPLYPSGPNFGTANGGTCDFADVPNPQGTPSGEVTASAADNGYAGFLQPANNSASFYDLTGGTASQPTVFTATNLCDLPWAIAMGTFGTETDGFVACAGTPVLRKVRASDAYAGEEPALPLPGVTPLSDVVKATFYSGGLYVVVFDSGPASGTVVILSVYDQLLLLVNQNTWAITQSIKLTGNPFRIVADAPNGRVLVEFADPANKVSTFAWVDALSGAVTPSNLTSSLLGVGLAFDGTNIVPAMRNQPSLPMIH